MKKLFCNHTYKFHDKFLRHHYLLWYHSHNTFHYEFKCSECNKKLTIQVTPEEFNRRDNWFFTKLTQ